MNMTLSDGAGQSVPVRQKPAFYASEKKRRWARDLFEHGYGYTKVASILELSENTVRDWQREYRKGRFRVQIADNQLRYSDELREKVLKMRAEGGLLAQDQRINPCSCFHCPKVVCKGSSQ